MTAQEAFEAWSRERHGDNHLLLVEANPWKAAWAAALEEAAQECDRLAREAWGTTEEEWAFEHAASQIRSLKVGA